MLIYEYIITLFVNKVHLREYCTLCLLIIKWFIHTYRTSLFLMTLYFIQWKLHNESYRRFNYRLIRHCIQVIGDTLDGNFDINLVPATRDSENNQRHRKGNLATISIARRAEKMKLAECKKKKKNSEQVKDKGEGEKNAMLFRSLEEAAVGNSAVLNRPASLRFLRLLKSSTVFRT